MVGELFFFMTTSISAVVFFIQWYRPYMHFWPQKRISYAFIVLGSLPLVSLTLFLYVLTAMASYDVQGIYVFLYAIAGFAWIYAGLYLLFPCFDLSWRDDALNLQNKAALPAVGGCFLALSVIYAGANIGDGPGWWCVVFAGGLGTAAWFGLGFIINRITHMTERITVDRDFACGLRFGLEMLACGLLFARASAGDWTSFAMTVVEFFDGWPVLILAGILIAAERFFFPGNRFREGEERKLLLYSLFFGLFCILFAALSIYLLPSLTGNQVYQMP